MRTDLGPAFDPSFAGIPPHISEQDLFLWEFFRRRFARDYVRLFFDVALGRGAEGDPRLAPSVLAAWARLTRFRADIVGDRTGGWDIIELRPNAGPGAVGSLQVYTALWHQDPPDARPVRAVLVTDACARDIVLVGRVSGIDVRCLNELVGGPGGT